MGRGPSMGRLSLPAAAAAAAGVGRLLPAAESGGVGAMAQFFLARSSPSTRTTRPSANLGSSAECLADPRANPVRASPAQSPVTRRHPASHACGAAFVRIRLLDGGRSTRFLPSLALCLPVGDGGTCRCAGTSTACPSVACPSAARPSAARPCRRPCPCPCAPALGVDQYCQVLSTVAAVREAHAPPGGCGLAAARTD